MKSDPNSYFWASNPLNLGGTFSGEQEIPQNWGTYLQSMKIFMHLISLYNSDKYEMERKLRKRGGGSYKVSKIKVESFYIKNDITNILLHGKHFQIFHFPSFPFR